MLTSNMLTRENFCNSVLKQGYLAKLIDVFHMVDDLNSESDYQRMFAIFRDLGISPYNRFYCVLS